MSVPNVQAGPLPADGLLVSGGQVYGLYATENAGIQQRENGYDDACGKKEFPFHKGVKIY